MGTASFHSGNYEFPPWELIGNLVCLDNQVLGDAPETCGIRDAQYGTVLVFLLDGVGIGRHLAQNLCILGVNIDGGRIEDIDGRCQILVNGIEIHLAFLQETTLEQACVFQCRLRSHDDIGFIQLLCLCIHYLALGGNHLLLCFVLLVQLCHIGTQSLDGDVLVAQLFLQSSNLAFLLGNLGLEGNDNAFQFFVLACAAFYLFLQLGNAFTLRLQRLFQRCQLCLDDALVRRGTLFAGIQ